MLLAPFFYYFMPRAKAGISSRRGAILSSQSAGSTAVWGMLVRLSGADRRLVKEVLVSTLRSVVFCGLWGLWTALFGLAIPLLWGIRSPPRLVRTLSRVWARGILVLLSSIVGLRYVECGREHVPRTPSLIVSNHQSMWETLAALVLFPDVAIVAKRELLRIPIMGWYLKRAPMIVIDRGMASKA